MPKCFRVKLHVMPKCFAAKLHVDPKCFQKNVSKLDEVVSKLDANFVIGDCVWLKCVK